jgi:hypothetical protein
MYTYHSDEMRRITSCRTEFTLVGDHSLRVMYFVQHRSTVLRSYPYGNRGCYCSLAAIHWTTEKKSPSHVTVRTWYSRNLRAVRYKYLVRTCPLVTARCVRAPVAGTNREREIVGFAGPRGPIGRDGRALDTRTYVRMAKGVRYLEIQFRLRSYTHQS